MEEKVASIEKILEIKPHTNADLLELAVVKGFQTVVKKGEFKPGDFVVYISSDSVLNEHPVFEFLRKSDKKGPVRIRQNVRLRGEVSNGICFPLDILQQFPKPETWDKFSEELWKEGEEISSIIGASHYEKPVPVNLAGEVRGNFPPFIPKTNETRLASEPRVLDELRGKTVYITQKMDGTSFTIVNKDGEVEVCSRTLSKKLENVESTYVSIALKYNLIEKIKALGNYGIQGEIIGPSIQKNPVGLKELELNVFNVYNVDTGRYLDYEDMKNICEQFQLKMVPLISICEFNYTLPELVEMSKGKYEGTNNPREGIVIRPVEETYSETMKGRLSVKIINPEYKDE